MCRGCVFVLLTLCCDPSYLVQFCGEKQNDVDPLMTPPTPRSAALPRTTRQPTTNISYEGKINISQILIIFYTFTPSIYIEGWLSVWEVRDHPFPSSPQVSSISVTLCWLEAAWCSVRDPMWTSSTSLYHVCICLFSSAKNKKNKFPVLFNCRKAMKSIIFRTVTL